MLGKWEPNIKTQYSVIGMAVLGVGACDESTEVTRSKGRSCHLPMVSWPYDQELVRRQRHIVNIERADVLGELIRSVKHILFMDPN